MHFLTLVPVAVPTQEPDTVKDILVQTTLMELRDKMENRGDRAASIPITRVEYRSELIVRDSTAAPRREENHAAL